MSNMTTSGNNWGNCTFAMLANTRVYQDIDLNFTDFRQRINADLVGKFVNLASRCASFINKGFAGQLVEVQIGRLAPKKVEPVYVVGRCRVLHLRRKSYTPASGGCRIG